MSSSIDKVVEVVAQLRNPDGGCPWDLEQTHASLVAYLREETEEVAEVIGADDNDIDFDELKEELGDVLLQVLLHAQLANEAGIFTFDDVVETLTEKLIRRHPHVFGDSNASTMDEVMAQWERIKNEEKETKDKA